LAGLALAACAAAQTSGSEQPWTTTGQWSASVTQGTLTGPLSVDSSGDLLVANTLVGISAPTKTFGDTSAGWSWVSKLSARGVSVFGVQIAGVYLTDAVAADTAGNILIAGYGPAGGLPVTPNAYSSSPSGDQSAFACKLNSADGTPAFCTYLNSNQISIDAIGADANGNVYILAIDLMQSIVTTPGALSLGSGDVVLLKLDPTGQKLLYAAAFGGNGAEGELGLAVDADGNAYVAGVTSSTDFPGAANGAIPTPSGSFIAKVDPTGSKILYGSYGKDNPQAINVDQSGAAYVSGTTNSGDLYVLKFTPDGTAVAYQTVMGGADGTVEGAAVDSAGVLTIVGNAFSYGFPQHFSLEPCPALNKPYPANFVGNYMIRLAADGSLLQSTFFPAQLVFTPAEGSSIVLTQPSGGLLAAPTGDLAGVGVLQLGPASTPISPVGLGCIANGASFAPGSIAPGEIVSIFGGGLGPLTAQSWTLDSSGRIPSTLAGVQVTFDGTPAPLLYVQDAQINAITPWELAGKSTTEMCVVYNGNQQCELPSVGGAAPGVFTLGTGQAAALNQDNTLNSTANPAQVGSIVSVYVTGLGAISPAPADGAMVQLPLPALVNAVQIYFSNADFHDPMQIPAQVLYAGPAPLEVGGMFQINMQIPSGTNGTFQVNVQLPGGGGFSASGTVAVTPPPPIDGGEALGPRSKPLGRRKNRSR